MNLQELFAVGNTAARRAFSTRPPIPTQLKHILKANPEYEVTYALDESGNERKVSPKKKSVQDLLSSMGMFVRLRGVGFTRKNKKVTKRNRLIAKRSRARNR